VETVYSRFGSKANLLDAILGPAITGTGGDSTLLDRPEFAEIRASKDQRQQIQLLAHFSRTILERTAQIHRILHTAASVDPNAAELQRRDDAYRVEIQKTYISLLRKNGPLRPGLTAADAADTYSALANPTNYAFLTGDRGWTPDRFEEWLGDSLTQLLL
jgi:hypothetical protein